MLTFMSRVPEKLRITAPLIFKKIVRGYIPRAPIKQQRGEPIREGERVEGYTEVEKVMEKGGKRKKILR